MGDTRLTLREYKTDPELLRKLAEAAKRPLTREEREAQRRSWVIGEMLIENPDMSEAEAQRIYDEVR
jgi:hypothetical protein